MIKKFCEWMNPKNPTLYEDSINLQIESLFEILTKHATQMDTLKDAMEKLKTYHCSDNHVGENKRAQRGRPRKQ